MRGIFRRGLRLELVAGVSAALAMLFVPLSAVCATSISTTTTLTGSTSGSCPVSTSLTVTVTAASGTATGAVTLVNQVGSSAETVASAALDANGQATFTIALPDGSYTLTAVYAGSGSFAGSTSAALASFTISGQCEYAVSVGNLSPSNSLVPGQSGTATVTVTPTEEFLDSLNGAPGFITLSCSGLPDYSSCAFTPENIEIQPGNSVSVTSTMVIQTQSGSTAGRLQSSERHPLVWAFLLPGVLALAGLGLRGRKAFARIALLMLLAVVTTLGTTGCNPRYNYYHHGPTPNLPTPAGTYTVTVTGQSSNGISAIMQSTTLSLTVQ